METLDSVLVSGGCDPIGPPELMQFGQFVGAWDLDVIWYEPNGSIRRQERGEWHFGWILEGRAIADVWIVPPRSSRNRNLPPAGEYGMTVRFFDAELSAWRSTWHGPVNGVVLPFIARQVGKEMVLEHLEDGKVMRWIFSEVTATSFQWCSVVSVDEGATWQLDQKMFARRAGCF